MRKRLYGAAFAALILAACLSGCSKDSASATSDAAVKTAPGNVALSPERRQAIAERGRAHQAGGRIRARVMQQGEKP